MLFRSAGVRFRVCAALFFPPRGLPGANCFFGGVMVVLSLFVESAKPRLKRRRFNLVRVCRVGTYIFGFVFGASWALRVVFALQRVLPL